jgi:4-amino-4-deoxy-L-arabinose transferase-like glycosyltransferase
MKAPSVSFPAEPSRRTFWLLLAAIVLLGAGLRLWDIGTPQLWEDDYLNLSRAALPAGQLIAVQQYLGPADTTYDLQPPLVFLLQKAALALCDSVLAARAVSLAAGVASILGMGLLGAACAGRRAGLCAAALCAGALFHLDISRSIKLYGPFSCFLVFSLLLLHTALSRPGRALAALGGYAAVTAAMLWTGHQGVPVLAAQGLGVAGLFLARKAPFDGTDRLRRLLPIAWAMAVAVAVWLPIAAGPFVLQDFLANPSISPLAGLDAAFFADVLAGFFYLNYAASPVFAAALAALAVLGLMASRNAAGLLVLLAAAVPAAVVLTSQSDLRPLANWRHLITALPALCVFAGAGITRLGALVSRPLPGRLAPAASTLLAVAVVAGLLYPPLSRLGDYYQRSLTNDRDLFRFLDRTPGPKAALAFTGYQRNARAFAARWHLGETVAGPGNFDRPGYRRLRLVDQFIAPSPRLRAKPEGALLASWRFGASQSRIALAGLPSRAPLLLVPDAAGQAAYHDDFRDWRAYRDTFAMENAVVDTEVGVLRPERASRPATVVWRFDVPPGSVAPAVTAAIEAALYKRHPTLPADSRLTIEASPDGTAFTPLAVLGHDDFLLPDGSPRRQGRRFYEELPFYRSEARQAQSQVDLTPFCAGGSVWLRVGYTPGTREGFLTLAGVTVTARGLAPVPDHGLAFYAANLARNCASPAYRPDTSLLGAAAYVFAAPNHPELAGTLPGGSTVNGPDALAAVQAAQPGLEPAFILPDAAGTAAVTVYDPALGPDRGGVPLSGAAPRREVFLPGPSPLDAACLTLAGRINAPELALGRDRVAVPVAAPAGSVLRLCPGGQGLLSLTPDFDPPDFTDQPNAHSRNMDVSDSYPEYAGGVRCRPGTDCWFEYVFVSAFPVTELRLMAYPRLYGDAAGKRACSVAYAADGGPLTTVITARPDGPEQWTPLFARRFARVVLAKPANHVTVRFSLTADVAAEFWSPERPIDRMAIEAVLDARTFAPFALPPGASSLSLSGQPDNALLVWFSDRPAGRLRVWPGE